MSLDYNVMVAVAGPVAVVRRFQQRLLDALGDGRVCDSPRLIHDFGWYAAWEDFSSGSALDIRYTPPLLLDFAFEEAVKFPELCLQITKITECVYLEQWVLQGESDLHHKVFEIFPEEDEAGIWQDNEVILAQEGDAQAFGRACTLAEQVAAA